MYTLGAILTLLSIAIAFLHDNKVSSSSLNINSDLSGPVFFPEINASVPSPTNLAKRMDPLPNPLDFSPEILRRVCWGQQATNAIQLAVFKAYTGSPQPPLGELNTPSTFSGWVSISRYWTATETIGCNNLGHLNTVLTALGAPYSNHDSFHTWTLTVSQVRLLRSNLDTDSESMTRMARDLARTIFA